MITNRKRPHHVRVSKDSPYYKMSYNGYVSRARLAMAEFLDRCIGSDEYIYYEDGDCFNERISNLRLVSHKELNCLNKIRSIERTILKLDGLLQKYLSSLEDIRFNHTPCNCSRCKSSHESRQASYRM